MKENQKTNLELSKNLNYALLNLKQDIEEANSLEDKVYFELTKQQIIEYINYSYTNIKNWKNDYETNNYKLIANEYKEIESIISQLEYA